MNERLNGKTILITGAARRAGKIFTLACAKAGTYVVNDHGNSDQEALALGAILCPSDGNRNPDIIRSVPVMRWAHASEVEEASISAQLPRIHNC